MKNKEKEKEKFDEGRAFPRQWELYVQKHRGKKTQVSWEKGMLGGAQETSGVAGKEEPVIREPFVKGLVCQARAGRGADQEREMSSCAFQRKRTQPLCQHKSIRAWQGRARAVLLWWWNECLNVSTTCG